MERLREDVSVRIATYDFKNLAINVVLFLMSMDVVKRDEKFGPLWQVGLYPDVPEYIPISKEKMPFSGAVRPFMEFV